MCGIGLIIQKTTLVCTTSAWEGKKHCHYLMNTSSYAITGIQNSYSLLFPESAVAVYVINILKNNQNIMCLKVKEFNKRIIKINIINRRELCSRKSIMYLDVVNIGNSEIK